MNTFIPQHKYNKDLIYDSDQVECKLNGIFPNGEYILNAESEEPLFPPIIGIGCGYIYRLAPPTKRGKGLLELIVKDGRFRLDFDHDLDYLMFTKINGEKVSMKEIKDLIDIVSSMDHCAFCMFGNIDHVTCSDTRVMVSIDTESG